MPDQQLADIDFWARQRLIVNVLEIGFNAGQFAQRFLAANKHARVTSFGTENAPNVAAHRRLGNRHTMVIGDPATSVHHSAHSKRRTRFDLIFINIDNYNAVIATIMNCTKLAHRNTVIILNDVVTGSPNGPTRAWKKMVDDKVLVKYGTKQYGKDYGMAIGRFELCAVEPENRICQQIKTQ